MSVLKDLTNMRFGRLVVQERADDHITKNGERIVRWLCLCDCGNLVVVRGKKLREGSTNSCGCYRRDLLSERNTQRTPANFQDLCGQTYGRLTVISQAPKYVFPGGQFHTMWNCRCTCGNSTVVSHQHLVSGRVKSCGCYGSEMASERFRTHGASKSRLYKVWRGMIDRCTLPSHKSYKDYGGAGVRICDEWRTDFCAFRDWAFKNGYDENLPSFQCTIDRIDPYGNYEPTNCRWVPMSIQIHNKKIQTHTDVA